MRLFYFLTILFALSFFVVLFYQWDIAYMLYGFDPELIRSESPEAYEAADESHPARVGIALTSLVLGLVTIYFAQGARKQLSNTQLASFILAASVIACLLLAAMAYVG